MKIANVDFPEPLLAALRDKRLVVFAGAGVSMGAPAGLPSFRELARRIAEGTGQTIGQSEPEDQFLGRLKEAGTDVHRRAVQLLQDDNPEPSDLHRNLLRLYTKNEDVRIVTTNFELLFEQAAGVLFTTAPKVFEAPSLPLGERFQGIVQIHGSVNEPEEMILTSRDFGRAYLTEADGWARRFIVDLFVNFTVLFVGYSHSDTIMTYLTPSLARYDVDRHYALIGSQSDEPERWRNLGIQPIAFPQDHQDDYSGLDNTVDGLANHVRRGILDWQREIISIASGLPPIDEEAAGIIEHALGAPALPPSFTGAAEKPEWIDWLDRRGHLANLFSNGELDEVTRLLGYWLASRFALTHDDALFRLVDRHGDKLHQNFWWQLSWQMQHSIKIEKPDRAALTRLSLFLSSIAPKYDDLFPVLWIAEACASVGETDGLLLAYDALTASLNRRHPSGEASGILHHRLETMWEKYLEPHLSEIAEPLLERTVSRMQQQHAMARAQVQPWSPWGMDNILTDITQNCLEWLSANQSVATALWAERLTRSQSTPLRQLAIHATSIRTDISADDKIVWLLKNYGVHEPSTRHDLFKATRLAYPQARLGQRKALIETILDYRAPNLDFQFYDKDESTARHHFDWLHWLSESDPDCTLSKQALGAIRANYPNRKPSKHPGHAYWIETVSPKSPWSPEELLKNQPTVIVHNLLEYQPTPQEMSDGYGRLEMLQAVQKAAQQNAVWGIELADSMAESGQWDTKLWRYVITAWETAELETNHLHQVLSHLADNRLHQQHNREIAGTLSKLVERAPDAEIEELLPKANAIAVRLQQYATETETPDIASYIGGATQDVEWVTKAINHPSGKLAEFWIQSIARWHRKEGAIPQSLNDEYRTALDNIVQDETICGRLGRTILASRFHFLMFVDEAWTLENILPLFEIGCNDFQSAWHGFLTWGRMTSKTAEHLRGAFIDATERIDQLGKTREMRSQFARHYANIVGLFTTGPTDRLITEFFRHGDSEIKRVFAIQTSGNLRSLNEEQKKEWWERWLKGYWENRLLGIPAPLDKVEIEAMLRWPAMLPANYPEAVDSAVQMSPVQLPTTVISELFDTELLTKYPESSAKQRWTLGHGATQKKSLINSCNAT